MGETKDFISFHMIYLDSICSHGLGLLTAREVVMDKKKTATGHEQSFVLDHRDSGHGVARKGRVVYY